MKKFKNLREQINEDSESYYDAKYRVGPIGGNNEVDQPDAAIFDLARPESVRRINTYLGAASKKPTIDPNSVLRQIQRKLAIIGLQFSIPTRDLGARSRYGFDQKGDIDDGGTGVTTRDYDLTYLGGRFGVLDNTGKIGYDDNISHRLGHGLALRVVYRDNQDGSTTVMPKIVERPAVGNNQPNVPSLMNREVPKEEFTTQKTGMTLVPPKVGAGDNETIEKESKFSQQDIKDFASRKMRSMTPGQT